MLTMQASKGLNINYVGKFPTIRYILHTLLILKLLMHATNGPTTSNATVERVDRTFNCVIWQCMSYYF